MKNQILSDNELAVLNALWNAGKPLSRPEILQRITKSDWNPNSIHLILNNLIKKGFVQVGGFTRCGQNYGRTYYPLRAREDIISSMATYMLPDCTEEDRVLHVMTAMTQKGISEKTIRELEEMLEQRRKELQQENLDSQEKE